MAPTGLLTLILSAIQASLSVLLVLSYGGLSAHYKLLDGTSTRAISKVCVKIFLPALLFAKIGSELHSGSAKRYGIILIWAIVAHFVSFLIGIAAHFWLKMPNWITCAIMFNNTTSYPLLLIQSLEETGILSNLIAHEPTRDAVERAKSYFLVFATVSSCLTFAVGPRLIDDEHAPEPPDDKDDEENGGEVRLPQDEDEVVLNEETPMLSWSRRGSRASVSFFPSRPLAEEPLSRVVPIYDRRPSVIPKRQWITLGPRTKWWLLFISDFFNAPLLGATVGAVVGLVPALHRAFFNDTDEGGIFTAWLTASLQTVGSLFVPLPVVIAGVSLYLAMKHARTHISSGDSGGGSTPWGTTIFVLMIRFVVWPVMSITLIYSLVKETNVLDSDPMLWFAMMLMPTGPPAMKLITLVQVSDAAEEDEHKIAKLLTISYMVSPILAFTVVAALRASQSGLW